LNRAAALTTINYAAVKVSDLAIDRLLSLIADVGQPPQVTLIEPELIIWRSCGSSAVGR